MEESSSNELIKAVLMICSKQDQSNRRMWDLLERLLRFAKGDKDLGNVVARLSQEWISKEQDAYFQPRAMLMLLNLISILKRDGNVHLKWSFALMRGIYYDQKREQQRQYEREDRRRIHRNVPRLQMKQMIGSRQDEREMRRESCREDGRRARSQIRSIFEVAAEENEKMRGESCDQRLDSGREEKNAYFRENGYSVGFREEQIRESIREDNLERVEKEREKFKEQKNRKNRKNRNIEYDKDLKSTDRQNTSLAFKETQISTSERDAIYRNTIEERSEYLKPSQYNNEARLYPLLKYAQLSKSEKKYIYKDDDLDNLEARSAQLAQSECDEDTQNYARPRRSVSIGDELESELRRLKDSYEDKTASSRYRTDFTIFNPDSLSRRDGSLSDELKPYPESDKDQSKKEEPRYYINSDSEEEYVRERELNEEELEAQRRRFRKSPLNKLRSARKDTSSNKQAEIQKPIGYTPPEDELSSKQTPAKKPPIHSNLRSYLKPEESLSEEDQQTLSNPSSQASSLRKLSFYKGPESQLSEEESPYQSKQATNPSSTDNLRSLINKPSNFSLKNEDVFSTPPYKDSSDSSISGMHLSFGEDQEPSSILVKSQSSEELTSSRATLSSRDKLTPVRSDIFPSFGNQEDHSIGKLSISPEDMKPCSIPSIRIQPPNSPKSLPKHDRNPSFGKDFKTQCQNTEPQLSRRSNTSRASQYEDSQLSKRSDNSSSDDLKSQDHSRSSRSMSLDSPSSSSHLNRSTSNIPRRSKAWQKLLRSGRHNVQDTSISKAPESESVASERLDTSSNPGTPKELKPKLSLQIVNKEGSSESSHSQDSRDFTFRNDTKSNSKPELSTTSFFGANIEGIGTLESSDEGKVVLMTDTFNSPRHADIEMERAYQDYFTKTAKTDIPDSTNIPPFNQSEQEELAESTSKRDKPVIERRERLRSAKIPSAKPDEMEEDSDEESECQQPSIENIENYHLEAIASQEELETSSNPYSETIDRKGSPGLPDEDLVQKRYLKPENKYEKPAQDASERVRSSSLENERLSTQTPELSYIHDKLEPIPQLYMKKRNINSLIISKPSASLKEDHSKVNPDYDDSTMNTSNIPNIRTPFQLLPKLIEADEPEPKDEIENKQEESISGIDESLDAQIPVWNLNNRLKVRSGHINKSRDSSFPSKLSDQDFEVSAINSSSHSYLPGDLSEAQNASSIEQSAPLSNTESLPNFSQPSNQPAFLSIHKPELYSTHGRFHSFNPIYQNLEISRASGLDIISQELEEPKARSKSALEITRIYEGARTEPKLEVKIKIKGGFGRSSPEVNARIENSAEKSERVVETHSLADIEPSIQRGRVSRAISRKKENHEFDLASLIPNKEESEESSHTDSQNQRLSKVSRGFRILDKQFLGQRSAQATPKATNSKELSRHSSVSPMRLVPQPVPTSSIFKALESKLSQSRENLAKSSTPELSLITSKTDSASTAKLGHSSQDFKELRSSQYKPEPIEMPISPSYSIKVPQKDLNLSQKSLRNHLSASHEPATRSLNHSIDSESSNIPFPQPHEESFGVQHDGKLCLSPNLLTELSKTNPTNPSSISHTRYSSIAKQVSDETQPESYSNLSLSPYKQPEKSDTDTSQSQLANLKASTLPQKRLQFLTQDAQTSISKEASESPHKDAQSLEPICNSSYIMQSPEPSFPSYEDSRKEPSSLSKPPRSVIRSEDNVHLRSSDSYDTEESIPDFKPSSISNPKYSPSRGNINFDALQIRQLKTPELSEIAGEGHDESYSGPSESFEDMNLSKDHFKSGYLTDEERSDEGAKKKSAIYVIDEENSEVTDTHMYDRLSSDPSPRTEQASKYRKAPRRLEDDFYEKDKQDNQYKKQPKDLPMKLREDKLRLYSEGYPVQQRAHSVAKQAGVGLNQPRQPDSRLREASPRYRSYKDTNHSYSNIRVDSSDLYSYNSDSKSLQSSTSFHQDQSYSNRIESYPRSLKDYKEDKNRSKPSKEYPSDLRIPSLHHDSEPSDDSHIYTQSYSNPSSIPPKPAPKRTSTRLPQKSKSSNPILPSQDHSSSYPSTDQSHSSRASRRYTNSIELLSDSQIEASSKYPHYYLTDESSPSFKYQPNTQILTERSDSLVEDYIDTKKLNLIYQTKIKAADRIALVIYKKQILFLKDFFNSIHLIKIKLLLKQLENSHRYQRNKKILTKCFIEWHRQIQERKIYTYLMLLKLEKYCSRIYSQEINTVDIFSKKAGAFLLWKIASKLRARRTPLKLSKQLDSSTSTIPFGSEYQSPYQSRYSPRSTNQQFKNSVISSFENPTHDKLSIPSINFNYSFRPAQTIEKLLLRPPNSIHQYIDDMYEVSKEKLEAFYLSTDYNTKRYQSSPIHAGNLSSKSTPQRLRYCLNTVGKPGGIDRNIL